MWWYRLCALMSVLLISTVPIHPMLFVCLHLERDNIFYFSEKAYYNLSSWWFIYYYNCCLFKTKTLNLQQNIFFFSEKFWVSYARELEIMMFITIPGWNGHFPTFKKLWTLFLFECHLPATLHHTIFFYCGVGWWHYKNLIYFRKKMEVFFVMAVQLTWMQVIFRYIPLRSGISDRTLILQSKQFK